MPTVVIIGAGIIGSATAYYLTEDSTIIPSDVHIVEASPELFASASGYAGGFLAKDWFSPPLASLGELSFELHKKLADEHNGATEWGYGKSISYSLADSTNKRGEDWLREGTSRAKAATDSNPAEEIAPPAWLNGNKLDIIGEGDTTAQVDPLRLSNFLLSTSISRGVTLHQPFSATSLDLSSSPSTPHTLTLASTSESKTTKSLPFTHLILAAGAWTPSVHRQLFPKSRTKLSVSSLAGHSLLLRSPRWPSMISESAPVNASCHAVFATDTAAGYSPELFSRRHGEIYIAGLNDASIPLPNLVTEREIDPKCSETLRKTARKLLGTEGGKDDKLEILKEGLCWRPVTDRGTPFIGRLDEDGITSDCGVYVATGHGPWGISLSLGTGKTVAELVAGVKTSADITQLAL